MLTDAAKYLAARGHDVHVVTSRLGYEGGAALVAEATIDGVVIHRIPTTAFGRQSTPGRLCDYLTFYFSVFYFLLRQLKPDDTVIAKTDPPMLSVPVALAARIKKARLVNWLQDLFPEVAVALGLALPKPLVRLLVGLRNQSLRQAQCNLVIGERMADRLRAQGMADAQIVTIANWADATVMPLAATNPLRARWQLDHAFVVGYSGNLGQAHEIQTLLQAISHLKQRPEIVFLLIGGGSLMDELKQAVQNSGVTNCRFHPYQPRDQLHLTLTLPDVHLAILNPQLEGLIVPSKVYGAWAAAKPMIFIGDAHGEIGHLLTAEQAGYVVAPGDGPALVQAIESLATDPQTAAAMGNKARALLESRFSASASLKKIEQVLS